MKTVCGSKSILLYVGSSFDVPSVNLSWKMAAQSVGCVFAIYGYDFLAPLNFIRQYSQDLGI